jgi:hypothetical protein
VFTSADAAYFIAHVDVTRIGEYWEQAVKLAARESLHHVSKTGELTRGEGKHSTDPLSLGARSSSGRDQSFFRCDRVTAPVLNSLPFPLTQRSFRG